MRKNYYLFWSTILIVILYACSSQEQNEDRIPVSNWKFHTGTDPVWLNPDFDDTNWQKIEVPSNWENQGNPDYDGYAFYRAKVVIPSSLKNNKKAGLAFNLGAIDDRDSTFLNGKLIGTTHNWTVERKYFVPFDDSYIKWDEENVIVLKVLDYDGPGGVYSKQPEIGTMDFVDFIEIDYYSNPPLILNNTDVSKSVVLKMKRAEMELSGDLEITVLNNETQDVLKNEKVSASISGLHSFSYDFKVAIPDGVSCGIKYKFIDKITGKCMESFEGIPYILTPETPEIPEINSAKVYGVRPGSPVIYRMPVTGVRPMKFWVEKLPEGLCIDPETGIITGKLKNAGEYAVILKAQNDKGIDSTEMKFIVGDKLALTPPMGWNSWNCWGLNVNDHRIRAAADAFVKFGLADYGWSYINIDDGWEAPERGDSGKILTNDKFPDMKELTRYVHDLGLKIGLYSSPGPTTCGNYLGSYLHEELDAKVWSDWGFDYIKYDWCGYSDIKPNPTIEEMKEPYLLMGDILKDMPRDMVYSLCQYGMGEVWKWGDETNANLWRTTGDITDTWESMAEIGFSQFDKDSYAKPGNWNDPDMLVVGKLGWGKVRPTRLTPDEQYTHISLWSLLASPLLIGCDLQQIDEFTRNLLCNPEVIAINQDVLGKQAERIFSENGLQVFVKPLEDGSIAVGMFNVSKQLIKGASLPWSLLNIEGKYSVRNVWKREYIGDFDHQFTVNIPAHGVALMKFIPFK